MRTLKDRTDVNKTDLVNFPNGRIKDNTGTGDGTAINESTNGDIFQFFEKLMRLYDIAPNGQPDTDTNNQLVEALRGIATKNDFIYPLSTNGTVLNVDIKLTQMLTNESIICLCAFNKGAETQIKGLGSATFFNLTYVGDFKTNEYVRLIKTNSGVSIIRLADWTSLNSMATELGYLKKASQVQEDVGVLDTVATTPFSNLQSFIKRVIGTDSANYLATALRNGLMSSADKIKLDAFDETIIGTGSVLADGTKLTQRKINFTSSRTGQGNYLITHNLGFSNYGVSGSSVNGNTPGTGRMKVSVFNRTNVSCTLEVSDDSTTNDADFAFMLFKL